MRALVTCLGRASRPPALSLALWPFYWLPPLQKVRAKPVTPSPPVLWDPVAPLLLSPETREHLCQVASWSVLVSSPQVTTPGKEKEERSVLLTDL